MSMCVRHGWLLRAATTIATTTATRTPRPLACGFSRALMGTASSGGATGMTSATPLPPPSAAFLTLAAHQLFAQHRPLLVSRVAAAARVSPHFHNALEQGEEERADDDDLQREYTLSHGNDAANSVVDTAIVEYEWSDDHHDVRGTSQMLAPPPHDHLMAFTPRAPRLLAHPSMTRVGIPFPNGMFHHPMDNDDHVLDDFLENGDTDHDHHHHQHTTMTTIGDMPTTTSTLDAKSLIKWRRRKMNTHKLRKLRKRTRASRRRWVERKRKEKEVHEQELDAADERKRAERRERKKNK